jgi:putative transposase
LDGDSEKSESARSAWREAGDLRFHVGLKAANAKVLKATWQRCRVHFMRNALAHAGKGQRQMVLALINSVFAQDTREAAQKQWRVVADQLREKSPKLSAMMDDSKDDVLAFTAFPKAPKTTRFDESTRALERGDQATHRCRGHLSQRRIDRSPRRRATARAEKEWQLQRRYMQLEGVSVVSDNQTARLSPVITD